MPGEPPTPPSNNHDDVGPQPIDLKNALPLNIYLGMEYASAIQSAIVFGNSIQPRKIKDFHQVFWHVYNYTKTAMPAEELDPDLIEAIDLWFDLMKGQSRNIQLIEMGVDFWLKFVGRMQEWGIGRLFEKDIDAPFMDDIMDNDFDLLSDKSDEEIIGEINDDEEVEKDGG